MGLFDHTSQRLSEQALNAIWYKQKVISNNIAHNDTPDFKAKTVSFDILIKEKYKGKYHPKSKGGDREANLNVTTTYERNTNLILDGNNVDMEKEQLELADAQYQYNAMIEHLNSQYRAIRTALQKK